MRQTPFSARRKNLNFCLFVSWYSPEHSLYKEFSLILPSLNIFRGENWDIPVLLCEVGYKSFLTVLPHPPGKFRQ